MSDLTFARAVLPAIVRARSVWLMGSVLCVFALAVVVRLGAQLALGFYTGAETWEQEEIARNILGGRGYVYDQFGSTWQAYAPPLYSLVIASVYTLVGISPAALGPLQALLGGVLAATVWAIAVRAGGRRVGVVAGVAAATHPGLVVYAARVHPLSLDAALAATAVLLILQARERANVAASMQVGALIGAALLTRATLVPFIALGRLLAEIRAARPIRTSMASFLIIAAVAASIAGPWVIRNMVVLGYPTITSGVGYVLWIGNNPHATGSALTTDGRPIIDAAPEVRDLVWGRPERIQDEIFRDQALAFIADDPVRALGADLKKLMAFWWATERTGLQYPGEWARVYALYYGAVVASSLIGVACLLRNRKVWEVSVMLLLGAVVSLEQSLFFVEGRHRWEIEAVLLVFASVGAVAIGDVVREGARRVLVRRRAPPDAPPRSGS